MINYPSNAAPDLLRKNLQMQMSLLTSLSGSWMKAAVQLGELNRQASRRLLEETAADMHKAVQIQSLPDAQAFLGEQSRSSLEKFHGYWQNVQAIAVQNWPSMGQPAEDQDGSPHVSSAGAAGHEPASSQRQEHEHEAHPSALVEKLIATAVAATPERRT